MDTTHSGLLQQATTIFENAEKMALEIMMRLYQTQFRVEDPMVLYVALQILAADYATESRIHRGLRLEAGAGTEGFLDLAKSCFDRAVYEELTRQAEPEEFDDSYITQSPSDEKLSDFQTVINILDRVQKGSR